MKVSREKIIMTSSNKSLYMHLVSVGRTGLVSLTLVRLRGHTRPVSRVMVQSRSSSGPITSLGLVTVEEHLVLIDNAYYRTL